METTKTPEVNEKKSNNILKKAKKIFVKKKFKHSNNQYNNNNSTQDTQNHINKWLLNSYEFDKDSFYPRTEFILDYQKYCRRPNDPPFPSQEVFNQINILFPSIMIVNLGTAEQSNIALKGLKAKPTKDSIKIELPYYCRWGECTVTKATESEVFKHIIQDHLKDQKEIKCQWKYCTKFHDKPTNSIPLIASHLKTHFPLKQYDKPEPKPQDSSQQIQESQQTQDSQQQPQQQPQQSQQPQQQLQLQQQSQPQIQQPLQQQQPQQYNSYQSNQNPYNNQLMNPQQNNPYLQQQQQFQLISPAQQNLINKANLDDNFEITGIPLTTALTLRNLARAVENHILFTPYESRLATLMTMPKLGKPISTIIAELRI